MSGGRELARESPPYLTKGIMGIFDRIENKLISEVNEVLPENQVCIKTPTHFEVVSYVRISGKVRTMVIVMGDIQAIHREYRPDKYEK